VIDRLAGDLGAAFAQMRRLFRSGAETRESRTGRRSRRSGPSQPGGRCVVGPDGCTVRHDRCSIDTTWSGGAGRHRASGYSRSHQRAAVGRPARRAHDGPSSPPVCQRRPAPRAVRPRTSVSCAERDDRPAAVRTRRVPGPTRSARRIRVQSFLFADGESAAAFRVQIRRDEGPSDSPQATGETEGEDRWRVDVLVSELFLSAEFDVHVQSLEQVANQHGGRRGGWSAA